MQEKGEPAPDAIENQEADLNALGGEDEDNQDAVIRDALGALPKVYVTSQFAPRVMSNVYIHHARSHIKPLQVFLYSMFIVVLGFVFFVWDVMEHRAARGIDSWGTAFLEKLDLMLEHADHSLTNMTGLLMGCWHLVTGVGGQALKWSSVPWLLLLIGLFVLAGFGIKKTLQSLYRVKR